MSFAGESVHRCRCYGEGDGLHGEWRACPPELCEADALLAEVERLTENNRDTHANLDFCIQERERLTAERDEARRDWRQYEIEEECARADAAERELAEERERNPSRVVCPRCQANLPCESCRQYSIAREKWERRAEAAEALAERRRVGLQAVIDYVPDGFVSPMDDEDSMNYRAIARAALADGGQET